ncbi:MAG: DNA-binding transcriptional regulator Fis [Chromatiaceae bacterium]|nr:DNA-binding transcriptional regulator Fis [Gammaproteobacteria bacterium]MCP5300243.1 DNA-binding transcriptional regulator Fis [Chromatiaceae bacterium]MCP5422315.1 DNA-binding transcriptional regulator Fis [Chromatiaceae bacterium]
MSGKYAVVKTHRTEPLRDAVRDALVHYFEQLDGTAPNDLYQLVMEQVEQPLFETILSHTGGNQSRAATLLGISRSTLRKKLAQYEIE